MLILVSGIAFSQYFVKEYTYNASENDSKLDARGYALSEVKKLLIEELGVYISTTTNLTVKEQNDINKIIYSANTQTISECITQTKILDESWDGEYYYIKVQIYVDKKDFLRRLKKISKEESNISTTSSKSKETTETKPPDQLAFYGSFDLGLHKLNDDNFEDNISILVGVKLGLLINKHILLGLYANINTEQKYNDYLDRYLRYSDGGFFFGARFFRNFPLQLSVPVKLGIGGIKYFDNTWTIVEEDNDNYFVLEPGVELDFNVIKSFYVALGASYKMTDAISLADTPNNILNGFAINLSFKIIVDKF